MVRALDCGSRCWGFESPHSPQQISGLLDAPVAQWIRASASGAEGRRFESSQARFFSRKWAVSSAGRAADS
jgi:hypothetical protein